MFMDGRTTWKEQDHTTQSRLPWLIFSNKSVIRFAVVNSTRGTNVVTMKVYLAIFLMKSREIRHKGHCWLGEWQITLEYWFTSYFHSHCSYNQINEYTHVTQFTSHLVLAKIAHSKCSFLHEDKTHMKQEHCALNRPCPKWIFERKSVLKRTRNGHLLYALKAAWRSILIVANLSGKVP